jgi:cytochrome c oxidase subunit 3
MSAQFAQPVPFDEAEDTRYQPDQDLKNKRFGLLLWRLANAGVFAFFVLANYLMRQTQPTWPPPGVSRIDAAIPTIFSVLLLLSTFPANGVVKAIRQENRAAMQRNILVTLALGLIFLVGLVVIWRQVPIGGSYSAIFFTMTGFHAIHVIAGMLLFGFVLLKTWRGAYSKESYWGVEATVVFWHFVELMWLIYFIVLYIW